MLEFFETYKIGFYICFFLLPFLQEDVSVLGAASACASGIANPVLGFLMVFLGLSTSASLKYMLGRAAISQTWAQKYAENPRILKAGDNVKSNLGKSLYMARFVSAVRIPFYVASGFFRVNIAKFLLFVMSSAAIYLGIAFTLFHIFGEVAGDKMKIYLPILAILFLVGYFIFSKLRKPKTL